MVDNGIVLLNRDAMTVDEPDFGKPQRVAKVVQGPRMPDNGIVLSNLV